MHSLSVLLYLPVYFVAYLPLYPTIRSRYIFLCPFALGVLNRKTQLTKAFLSTIFLSFDPNATKVSWDLLIWATCDFYPYFGGRTVFIFQP